MQQHIEEFSASDVRHTLNEVLRIAGHRRWRFVFPFCLVSAAALIGSLWLPRQYATETVIKREHDPVFSTMVGKAWTHPYTEIKNRMLADLQDEDTIAAVLDELDLPEGLERFDNGALTPAAESRRRRLAHTISSGLSVKSLSSLKDSDVMSISLVMDDSRHMEEILGAIRDRYIATAKQRTIALLRDVEQFFRGESQRCRAELEALEQQILEYELKYPGINPDTADPGRTEQTNLVIERLEIERKLDGLRNQRQRLADRLAALTAPAGGEGAESAVPLTQPNPRYAEINHEINLLQKQIAENRTLRGMTDLHPTIVQLQNLVAMRREELARIPREVPISAEAGAAGAQTVAGLVDDLQRQITEADATITAQQARLTAIEETLARLEKTRIQTIEHRQDYLRLRQKEAQAAAELQSWEQNIGPIERIFLVEDANRTIHFATVKDVAPVTKPISPKALLVTLACLGIGAAAGVLVVLASELLDRSFRTIKQLKGTVGVPVIESIDEILTPAAQRRRMLRRWVVLPVATAACLAVVLLTGALAYLSIEQPGSYARLRAWPTRLHSVGPKEHRRSVADAPNSVPQDSQLADLGPGL